MPDIGRLLRVKNMIDSASIAPDETAAHGLTEGYMRLRGEVLELVGAELRDEFERVFSEIKVAEAPSSRSAGRSRIQSMLSLQTEAKSASVLLGQLAGWVQGLIDEQLLERRIVAEAEAKAKLEARPTTGFERPPD